MFLACVATSLGPVFIMTRENKASHGLKVLVQTHTRTYSYLIRDPILVCVQLELGSAWSAQPRLSEQVFLELTNLTHSAAHRHGPHAYHAAAAKHCGKCSISNETSHCRLPFCGLMNYKTHEP